MNEVLLIHPPVTIPGEPPAGIAKLGRVLKEHDVSCDLIDANLEGLNFLLDASPVARKHKKTVMDGTAFRSMDHYRLAIHRLNQALAPSGRKPWRVALANFRHRDLSPVRSADLIRHAEHPEENPFYEYYESKLLPRMESLHPEIVGISLIYLTQALCAFALIGLVRKRMPEVKIILGGGLITSWMSSPDWRNPFSGLVDACISGPGESALLSFVGKKWDQNRPVKPDYHFLPVKDYLSPGFILPVSTSTGCYWRRCGFCPERAEGNAFLSYPVDQIRRDLSEDVETYSPSLIHFLDNAIPPKTLGNFAESSIGVPWYGYSRFEPHLDDLEFCRALKESGCVMLQLGLESGSQNVLDRMEKGIVLDRVVRIFENLRDAGIATYIYLLFGTPSETVEDARMTKNFVIKHGDKIGWINPAIFNLPRNSPETTALKTHPFYEGDLSLYVDFDHPAGWSRMEVRRFLQSEFGKHPVIAPILGRTPPEFTSNHAPFFKMQIRSNPNFSV